MDSRIELRHLRYFVAVAEELHFNRAAKRLHIAQPPLSQQIRQLENILGHALFVRTSRVVKLTAAGEVFLQKARRTLQNISEDIEAVRGVGRGERGTLVVGFVGSAMLAALPAILGSYRKNYPAVQLRLRELYTATLVEAIRDGSVDVGFMRDAGPTEGLYVERWITEPFVAVLPKNHRLAKRDPIPVSELREEPFVFFARNLGPRAWDKTVNLCEQQGFRPNVVQEAPQWVTILRLVGAGLGVTIAPACVQRIATSDVVCRGLRPSRIHSDLELAYREGEVSAIARTFCEIAHRETNFQRA